MKNFNWRELLTQHSLFVGLNAKEVERIIDQLLDHKVSEEREYSKGKIIVREGELGDSVFLLGLGSVEVVLQEEDDHETRVAILKQGEFFGEMALLERKPRAATVRAIESCTLLEINGQEFLKLLDEHRDVESKMLLKLSERLRHANEQVVTVRLKGVDEKLKLFNEKVDAEVKKIAASVTEARAMTDHTKSRADDIISSFERTRNWLTWMLYFVITILTLGGMVSGGIGLWFYHRVNTLLEGAEKNVKEIENFNTKVVGIRQDIVDQLYMPMFRESLKKQPADAVLAYNSLQTILPNKEFFSPLYEIQLAIQNEKAPRDYKDYTDLLSTILQNAKDADRPGEVTQAYYLLLTNQILVRDETFLNGEKFKSTFSDLVTFVRDNKDRMKIKNLPAIEKTSFPSTDRIKLEKFLLVDKEIRKP